MSKELNKRLIEQTCEIIKLKTNNRDLLVALKRLLNAEHDEHLTPQGVRNLAKEVIAKAEGAV